MGILIPVYLPEHIIAWYNVNIPTYLTTKICFTLKYTDNQLYQL